MGSLIGFSQTPQDRQNFLFDLIVASFVSGRQLHPGKGRWKRDREREGWGREGVSEREILCQHSTISEEYFDVDSSVDYQHFTRVVKAKTAACRYVRFRWRTCFFFFFSLGFSYHLESPEWCWISLFHWVLSSVSSSFNPTLFISLLHESSVKEIYKNLGNHVRKPACTRSPTLTHARTHVRLYITGLVYRIITNTFASLTLYCSVRFPGR